MKAFSLTHFSDLGLHKLIQKAVQEAGYETPTPIQAGVIPAMIEGHDVLGIAQTGTGKTASFVLPSLNIVANGTPRPAPKTCRTLILTPTRELATQIAQNIRTYAKFIRISTTTIVGGAKAGPQIKSLSRGLDIVIATPGRLLDHLKAGKIDLSQTQTVILDEADQMMDMGFIPGVREVLKASHPQRQCVMLSATMPRAIRALADEFLKDPVQVSVAPQSKPIERIDQSVWFMERAEKIEKLKDLLGEIDVDRAIVFTRTKRIADKVTDQLEKSGFGVTAIHGDKTQPQRAKSLRAFREGKVPILVATDIAARGLDIDGVSHVFNYELPNVPEAYVHRIGRTARAGASGKAISFCEYEERSFLFSIERLTKTRLRFAAADEAQDGEVLEDPRDEAAFGRNPPPPRGGRGQGQGQGRGGRRPQSGERRGQGQGRGRPGGKAFGQGQGQGRKPKKEGQDYNPAAFEGDDKPARSHAKPERRRDGAGHGEGGFAGKPRGERRHNEGRDGDARGSKPHNGSKPAFAKSKSKDKAAKSKKRPAVQARKDAKLERRPRGAGRSGDHAQRQAS